MEDTTTGRIFSKIVVAIFILTVLDLMFINWWILRNSSENTDSKIDAVSPVNSMSDDSNEVNDYTRVDDPIQSQPPSATPSSTQTASVPDISNAEEVVVQTANKEIFIPLGGGTSTSTTFEDLLGAEVSIDTTKYSAIDYVNFEASIWVKDGNGRAWAQLKNVSDNNPLIESQISNPTSTPTLKSSGKIPLAQGSKVYRVQAKTDLGQYSANIDNARLKIVLK